MLRFFLLLAFSLPLSACGGDDTPLPSSAEVLDHTAEPDDTVPVPAYMDDGVQVVEVEVTPTGYRPARIQLQAGIPARLVFTRLVEGECPSHVQAPALGIAKTFLPMGEPHAVEFTPAADGSFGFTCGMDMMEGTVLVQS